MTNLPYPAPIVQLPRDGGGELALSELQPSSVVLFFYPRDNTSGCTKEAQAFTAHQDAFEKLNVKIIGISKDSVKSHDKFVEKQGLGMPLLSDEKGDICEQFGVWKEKSRYGKTYMGIERTTVLIGADGKIAHIWPKVKVVGHAEAVLEAVKAL